MKPSSTLHLHISFFGEKNITTFHQKKKQKWKTKKTLLEEIKFICLVQFYLSFTVALLRQECGLETHHKPGKKHNRKLFMLPDTRKYL